jgi:hypothetical protein
MINRASAIALCVSLFATTGLAQGVVVNCGMGNVNANSCVNGLNTVNVTNARTATTFGTDVRFAVASTAIVSAGVNTTLTAYTAGPVRAGRLVATAPVLSQGMHTSLIYGFTVGASCFGTSVGCMPGGLPPDPLPFTLGEFFDFRAFMFAQTNPLPVFTSTFVLLNFSYRLTELDGSPVTVLVTPEPSTFVLLGVGLLALAGITRRASRATHRPATSMQHPAR